MGARDASTQSVGNALKKEKTKKKKKVNKKNNKLKRLNDDVP